MRKNWKIFTAIAVLAMILLGLQASAESVYPESEHPYAENSDISWEYTHPESAYALKITFSDDTEVESNFDFIYITDSAGTTSQYTGTALAGKTLYLTGSSFTIRLTSDSVSNRNGFTITEIVSLTQEEYEEYLIAPKFTINSSGVITAYEGIIAELTVPAEINGIAVTGIGSSAFAGNTYLTSVTLSEGVTSIGDSAFEECSSLTSIVLPDSVTSIGLYVFYECTSLTSVNIPDRITSISNSVFYRCTSLVSIDIPDSVTSIGNHTFSRCSSLTSINIPDSVTSIGNSAFYGCTSLASVDIPDSVESFGASAFSGCSSLASVNIPDSITFIGDSAFKECSSLVSIDIPNGVTSISDSVFYNCTALTDINIPESVTTIGNNSFFNCDSLTSIIIPEGVTSISTGTFYSCASLTSISLPDSLNSIGSYAFGYCNLAQVTVPEGVTSIGDYAFEENDLLEQIELPDGLESIGLSAFPINTVLVFGDSDIIRQYAIDNGLQYISNTESVLRDDIDTVEEKIAWIVDTYIDSGMSEYEKALTLHDWLVANVVYDYDYAYNDAPAYSEYGVGGEAAIMDGSAVCHGYTQAYMWLLEAAGMEAKYVSGYDHAWNIVKIDGEWYHVDVTWDDPIGGHGYYYNYFGLSDMAIHTEPENHATQYTYRHLVCDSWEANYFYKNGYLDAALAALRSTINDSITAGTYSGSISLDYNTTPSGGYAKETIALILNSATDWDIPGYVVITPNSIADYDFVFYPDEEPVTAIVVEGIEFSDDIPECYYMYPGYETQLNVNTMPAGRKVSFSSSDESIITVSEDGLVKAVGAGTAHITLTSGNFSREFSLSVENYYIPFTSYTCYIDQGETFCSEISAHWNWFLTDSAVVWSSADETIATVDQNGRITGVNYGKTTVTALWGLGKEHKITVYVRKPVTAVVFDQEIHEAYTGQEYYLNLHLEGCDQDFFEENFYFSTDSSDASVASFYGRDSIWNADGAYWEYRFRILCNAPGEAIISIQARDGSDVTGSCTIIVKDAPPLTYMAFNEDTYYGYTNTRKTLTLSAVGEDPDLYKDIFNGFNYTSSDPTIAEYSGYYYPEWNDETGFWEYYPIITCHTTGEVTFTATARDGSGLTASCTIVITEQPQLREINFSSGTYEAIEGEDLTLTLTASGDDPDYYAETYRNFNYVSDDESIADIGGYPYYPTLNEETGLWEYRVYVDCLTPGEVTFTATAKDGSGVSGSCTIIVKEEPQLSEIVFASDTYEAMEGEELALILTASGNDPDYYAKTYRSFTYASGDNSIAKLWGFSAYPTLNEETGLWEYKVYVDCLAPGETTFTATAKDGSGVSGSCTIIVNESPKLSSIDFYKETYEGYVGDILSLDLYSYADDPDFYKETYGTFTYTSSDGTVARYYSSYFPYWEEDEGRWLYYPHVECLAPGEITFTATANDGSGVTDSCTIIVKEKPQLSGIVFASDTYEAMEGEVLTLTLTTSGDDPDYYAETHRSFNYTSGDVSIADLRAYKANPTLNEETGLWEYTVHVDCLAPGETIFTATAKDGSGVSGSCTIIVKEKPKLSAIAFAPESYEAMEGERITLTFHADAEDPNYYKENYGSFTYSFSDESVASIYRYPTPVWNEEAGYWVYSLNITALAPGETTFTATAKDGSGVSGSCTIIVNEGPKLTEIAFASETYEEWEGTELTVSIFADGEDPDFYKENFETFTYSSSDKSIASPYGYYSPVWNETMSCWEYKSIVKCIAPGEITYTATAKDGSGVSASCTVIVKEKPEITDVFFENDTYEAKVGDRISLNLYVDCENQDYYAESYGSFRCVSSKSSVASYYGYYTPYWSSSKQRWVYGVSVNCLAPGEVTFTATTKDGSGVSGSCTIIVKPAPDSISLSHAQLVLNSMGVGNQRQLEYIFEPANSLDTVRWSSSNPTYIHVNQSGLVTAYAEGSAVITATTSGGLTATCEVTARSMDILSLPDALTEIQDEAFIGNAVLEAVYIPEGTVSIGSGAFRNCSGLCYAFIPDSVVSIASDAFDGCSGLVVFCSENSYAHIWCAANNVAFDLS